MKKITRTIITGITAIVMSTMMASAQIDVHSHMITDSYLKAVKAHGLEMDEGFPIPARSADAHLKFMDEAGIRKPFFITMQKLFSNELQ